MAANSVFQHFRLFEDASAATGAQVGVSARLVQFIKPISKDSTSIVFGHDHSVVVATPFKEVADWLNGLNTEWREPQ
jgi:hypothetical protein